MTVFHKLSTFHVICTRGKVISISKMLRGALTRLAAASACRATVGTQHAATVAAASPAIMCEKSTTQIYMRFPCDAHNQLRGLLREKPNIPFRNSFSITCAHMCFHLCHVFYFRCCQVQTVSGRSPCYEVTTRERYASTRSRQHGRCVIIR